MEREDLFMRRTIRFACLIALSGLLFLISTIGGNNAYVLSQEDDPWETRASLLEANSEMAVAELEGLIFVLGGYPSSRTSVDTVQVYDPVTDSWSLASPMPQSINHHAAIAVDGILYVMGGQVSASGGGPFVDTTYAYDPATDSWSERASMPTARSGIAAAVVDGKIYVAGGRPPHGNDFAVYDPANDTWNSLPNMPTGRNHLGVVAIDNQILVIGGRFGAGFSSVITDVVEVFDTQTNTWTDGNHMPTQRSGHNAIVANGCLHVFGGEGNGPGNVNGLYPQHELYDPDSDSWTELALMPTPIHGVTGLAFIDGYIHLPGGGLSQGGSSGSTIHQVYQVTQSCN